MFIDMIVALRNKSLTDKIPRGGHKINENETLYYLPDGISKNGISNQSMIEHGNIN